MGKGPKKSPSDVGRLMRAIVGENVQQHMRARFPELKNDTARMEALARKAGTSKETVRRIITRAVGPSIDTIEDIARELRVPAPAMFVASDSLRAAVSVEAPPPMPPSRLRRFGAG